MSAACDNGDVVAVPEQQSIAAYRSDPDYVVIRQRCWPDADGVITVTPDMLPKLMAALDAHAGPATDTRNQPTASARRQQRYRDRQRKDRATSGTRNATGDKSMSDWLRSTWDTD